MFTFFNFNFSSTQNEKESPFEKLPDELIFAMLKELLPAERDRGIARVNRRFNRISKDAWFNEQRRVEQLKQNKIETDLLSLKGYQTGNLNIRISAVNGFLHPNRNTAIHIKNFNCHTSFECNALLAKKFIGAIKNEDWQAAIQILSPLEGSSWKMETDNETHAMGLRATLGIVLMKREFPKRSEENDKHRCVIS